VHLVPKVTEIDKAVAGPAQGDWGLPPSLDVGAPSIGYNTLHLAHSTVFM